MKKFLLIIAIVVLIANPAFSAQTTYTNDSSGAVREAAKTDNFTELYGPTVEAVTTTGSTLVLDYDTSSAYDVTINQNCAITTSNWPTGNRLISMTIVTTTDGAYTVTVEGISVALADTGTNTVIIYSIDGGTTFLGGVAD